MDIVIVESPAKASTINKYLGNDYKVIASYGHVRDLPEKEGSVQPEKAFAMLWQSSDNAAKHIQNILKLAKDSQRIILATDPDREGEAISWHVVELLKQKNLLADKEICRVVFNAITRQAVLEAMAHPRKIDMNLVDAYLARRALDYLVGFNLSPVLWRKLPGARSAGRVQSVALRLICERELEIRSFKPREYWSIETDFESPDAKKLRTRLVEMDGQTLQRFDIANAAAANDAKARIAEADFHVDGIIRKRLQRAPTPPFITSSLQQEAARKLGFSTRQTMQLAQKLYEGIDLDGETQGLITYMRTDSTQITPEAITHMRNEIGKRYGDSYLPDTPRQFRKKSAGAQEAHEAIRPVQFARDAKTLTTRLPADMLKLYDLIWTRAIASQMAHAQLERTTINVANQDKTLGLRANGTVVVFDGFLRLYEEGSDKEGKDEQDKLLPNLDDKTPMQATDISPNQHFTEAPPRYNEASLVKKMEELGIGRPSTYASILSVLRDRDYVYMDSKRFIPHDKGLLVIAFLENFFRQYVEYDFTADLETALDEVSTGKLPYQELLRKFWEPFHTTVNDTLKLRNTDVLNRMNEVLGEHIFGTDKDAQSPDAARKCQQCGTGELSLKTGRYGAFIGCTNYPECRFTRPFDTNGTDAPMERLLGRDPNTDEEIWLKTGRFGPYVQRGEAKDKTTTPKRAGLPKGVSADDIELEFALRLLGLPRIIGTHPESGEPISADIGRYGPYLRHAKQSASLEHVQDVFEIGVNRAVSVLEERKNLKGKTGRGQSMLHDLGAHPETGKSVQILNGRFGPYVRHDGVNASIPASVPPEKVDMDLAVSMLAARITKLKYGKGKSKRAKTSAKD